jgi:hypothetical protein
MTSDRGFPTTLMNFWTRSELWFNIHARRRWVCSIMRWSCLLGLVVAALPYAAYAGAPACSPNIVGPWTGQVVDGGRVKQLGTQFSVRSGELTGTYRVEDADGGYTGTLTDFTPSGDCAGQFQWHDRNGTGVVQVDFRPDRDRFDGFWGDDEALPGQFFTGRRYRPVPVS